ncbi:MAG: hypothetical protein R3C20_16845 [Planctomycetaceae bacterium]
MLLLICVLTSTIVLWPTLKPESLTTTVPTGSTQCSTVPVFNACSMWWNADRAASGFANYWHAPVFFPERGTFAFSEPQPATLVVAPLFWLRVPPVVSYKVYMLLSLTLNGLFGAKLLRNRFSLPPFLSATASIAVILLPIVHQQIDVIQLMPVWAILWTWESFDRLCERPGLRRAVVAGLAFGATFWLSIHHAMFLGIVLCGPVLLLVRKPQDWHLWTAAAVAILTAATMVLPLVLPIRKYLSQHEFERQEKTVAALSAVAADYLHPQSNSITSTFRPVATRRQLSVGWLRWGLGLLGIFLGVCRPRTQRMTLFLCATAVLSFFLSLGTNLQVSDFNIWKSLVEIVPGLGWVRNVFRFAYFVQLVLVVFSFVAIHRLSLQIRIHIRRLNAQPNRTAGYLWCVAVAAVCLIAVIEQPPAPFLLVAVPDLDSASDWTDYVQSHLKPGNSILCLPFPPGQTVRDLEITAHWMYYQIRHGRPMLNGYSGFFPARWFQLQHAVNTIPTPSFPEFGRPSLNTILRGANVQLIVVSRKDYDAASLVQRLSVDSECRLIFSSADGKDIYQITWHPITARQIP